MRSRYTNLLDTPRIITHVVLSDQACCVVFHPSLYSSIRFSINKLKFLFFFFHQKTQKDSYQSEKSYHVPFKHA